METHETLTVYLQGEIRGLPMGWRKVEMMKSSKGRISLRLSGVGRKWHPVTEKVWNQIASSRLTQEKGGPICTERS